MLDFTNIDIEMLRGAFAYKFQVCMDVVMDRVIRNV
jgi:hypothetical protein